MTALGEEFAECSQRMRTACSGNSSPFSSTTNWTAHRVSSVRRVNGIHAYRSAEKNGEWLTMSEAATTLGVTHHRIRRLIKAGILPAEQVVPGAPYQIRADDLQHERVAAAIGRTSRPCYLVPAAQACRSDNLLGDAISDRRYAQRPRGAGCAGGCWGLEV